MHRGLYLKENVTLKAHFIIRMSAILRTGAAKFLLTGCYSKYKKHLLAGQTCRFLFPVGFRLSCRHVTRTPTNSLRKNIQFPILSVHSICFSNSPILVFAYCDIVFFLCVVTWLWRRNHRLTSYFQQFEYFCLS
jgi:hypothetical protein